MDWLDKLSKVGLEEEVSLEQTKQIKIVNFMCIVSIFIAMSLLTFLFFFGAKKLYVLVILLLTVFVASPLYLNYRKKYLLAAIFFLTYSYILIFCLAVFFSTELYFKYYLIPGVGMPLIFLTNEDKRLKWGLVLIALPVWLLIEYCNYYYPDNAILKLDSSSIYIIGMVSYAATLLTSGSMFYVFVKKNEEQLKLIKEKNEELLLMNQDMRHFTYILTHDLKRPLKSITGILSLINDGNNDLDEDLKHFFKLLEEQSVETEELIDNVLTYSKIGKGKPEITTIDLDKLISTTVQMLKIPKSYKVNKEAKLPSVVGNYSQLSQVFNNLISNAVKYHHKPEGAISIIVEELNEESYKIKVKDDGPGIAPEYHQQIFDFFGTANKKERLDSSGIGLAIVKKIVGLYNGELGVVSEEGKGATFWFTWPKKMDLS